MSFEAVIALVLGSAAVGFGVFWRLFRRSTPAPIAKDSVVPPPAPPPYNPLPDEHILRERAAQKATTVEHETTLATIVKIPDPKERVTALADFLNSL